MPETKEWAAFFYLVAQTPLKTSSGEIDLDVKADEVLREIKAAAAKHDMYVAYRVVHTDVNAMVAGVAGDPLPETIGWFTNSVLAGTPVPDAETMAVDVTGFFNWAFERCPARHYAVFFWGHSFGPAGLFNVGEPVILVLPPDFVTKAMAGDLSQEIIDQQAAWDSTNFTLKGDQPLNLQDLMQFGLQGLRHYLQWITVRISRKIDVVLFQDCWMSTLETAYELQDVVRYVVASQSLVPIALNWNYDWLFTDLENKDFPGLVRDLGKQYKPFVETFPTPCPFPAVPYTLMDLGQSSDDVTQRVTPKLEAFVDALIELGLSKNDRGGLMTKATIFSPKDKGIQAGDIALVDLRKLCSITKPASPKMAQAADALENVLAGPDGLVRGHYPQPAAPDIDFQGVSVFYCPIPSLRDALTDDRFIWLPLLAHTAKYLDLKLAKTKWVLPFSSSLAFEQSKP